MRYFQENDYAQYEISEGILHITYKKDVDLDIASAIMVVKDRLKMHEGLLLPVLCDIRNLRSLDRAARRYLSQEGSTLIKAVAVLADSPVSSSLSEFFVLSTQPPIPIQTFSSKEGALNYLKGFLHNNH